MQIRADRRKTGQQIKLYPLEVTNRVIIRVLDSLLCDSSTPHLVIADSLKRARQLLHL